MNRILIAVIAIFLITGCSLQKQYEADLTGRENSVDLYLDPVITGEWERAELIITLPEKTESIENISSTCSCLRIEKTKTDKKEQQIYINYEADMTGMNQSVIILDTGSDQYYLILLYNGQ